MAKPNLSHINAQGGLCSCDTDSTYVEKQHSREEGLALAVTNFFIVHRVCLHRDKKQSA